MNWSMKRSKINKKYPNTNENHSFPKPMRCSKSSFKKKFFLKKKKNELKKYKKYQVNNLTYRLKKWEKEQVKPKVITNNDQRGNKQRSKQTTTTKKKDQGIQKLVFGKDIIDELLVRVIKKTRGDPNKQKQKWKM